MANKDTRTLKVYYTGPDARDPIPQIRFQGKWLEEYGFKPGTVMDVKCEKGKITLIAKE